MPGTASTIKDFVDKYCSLYNVIEDEFTVADVLFIEDMFYEYCYTGYLPKFMKEN